MKLYAGEASGRGGRDLAADGSEAANPRVYPSVGDGAKQGLKDMRADGAHVASQPRPLRLLLSYHYYKDEDLDALLGECFPNVTLDLFADSGAYSAFSVGAVVNPEEYIAWINRWKHHFTCASAPDVIGDPVASVRETEKMLKAVTGIPVLPVFHVGEPWSYLDRWAKEVDYLALGGMVPYARRRNLLAAWLRRAYGHIPEGVRVHGFGLTTWPLLLAFPWYSVDSSSWTAGFRFAQLLLFDDRRGRFVGVNMADKKDLLANKRVLESYGLRPTQAQASGYDRDLLCGASIVAWQRAEEWLTRHKTNVRLHLGATRPGVGASGGVQSIGAGVREYLSCGSEDIEGAPNRPAGDARGLKAYAAVNNTNDPPGDARGIVLANEGMKSYLVTASASEGANNSPAAVGRGLKTYLSIGVQGEGAPNHPRDRGRAVKKMREPK